MIAAVALKWFIHREVVLVLVTALPITVYLLVGQPVGLLKTAGAIGGFFAMFAAAYGRC
jgi:hypothetical protein